jgi:phospholipid/cholesterol/gamma-HCH transport system permease protein
VRRLLALATAAPVRGVPHRDPGPWLARVADRAQAAGAAGLDGLTFLGEVVAGLGRLVTGRATCRRSDIIAFMAACGAEALPIISLISILVGLIFAFVGAAQLVMFGAQIYVAGLVGIALVRVMGAVMTGVVLSGRTGAAFAAQLGTMQVNEEVDALATLGVDPIDFLVLPRLIALALMMPLLCLYANAMGILGGMAVGVWLFEITPLEYIQMTRDVVRVQDLWVGLLHGAIFGVLVALTGCYKGLRCGRNAAAVGEAATGAVVNGIIGIIVATAVVTVMCNALGI